MLSEFFCSLTIDIPTDHGDNFGRDERERIKEHATHFEVQVALREEVLVFSLDAVETSGEVRTNGGPGYHTDLRRQHTVQNTTITEKEPKQIIQKKKLTSHS
jgi:hypothetical protein